MALWCDDFRSPSYFKGCEEIRATNTHAAGLLLILVSIKAVPLMVTSIYFKNPFVLASVERLNVFSALSEAFSLTSHYMFFVKKDVLLNVLSFKADF